MKDNKKLDFKTEFKYYLYDTAMGIEKVPGTRRAWFAVGLGAGISLGASFLFKKWKFVTIPLALTGVVYRFYQIKAVEDFIIESHNSMQMKFQDMLDRGELKSIPLGEDILGDLLGKKKKENLN